MSIWDRLWRRSPALPATHAPQLVQPVRVALSDLSGHDRRVAVLRHAIEPALARLALLGVPSDNRARVVLVAIAGQESDALHRRQHDGGPARGLWQFERGGGVFGVMSHSATEHLVPPLLAERGIDPSATAVWEALERDDVLAAALARLLLWTDPRPLPAVDDVDGGWRCYLHNWRPGAYTRGSHGVKAALRAKWAARWQSAREVVG